MITKEIEKEANGFLNGKKVYSNNIQKTLRDLLNRKGITSKKEFINRTKLNANVYKKINGGKLGQFDLWVLVSICFGLKLDLRKSMEILASGGFSMAQNCLTNEVYYHILSYLRDWKMVDVNIFIEDINEVTKDRRNDFEEVHILGTNYDS